MLDPRERFPFPSRDVTEPISWVIRIFYANTRGEQRLHSFPHGVLELREDIWGVVGEESQLRFDFFPIVLCRVYLGQRIARHFLAALDSRGRPLCYSDPAGAAHEFVG
jgi:hypothetical protein